MMTKPPELMTCDPNELVDLCDIRIDPSLPLQERMAAYVRQVGDPYLFKVDGLVIRAVYQPDAKQRLSDALCAAMTG